jgi:hypothetical protein
LRISHAEEAEHHLQVAFLVFHRLADFAGRVDAAARRRNDQGLAACQPDGALVGVLEGAAGLGEAVDPGLELGRHREVVERGADDDHVRSEELAHQAFGDFVFATLGFGRLGLHSDLDAERVGAEVVGGIHREVEVFDCRVRMALAPFGHHLGGELAGNGVGSQDTGIDVQQLHDQLSWKVPALKSVGVGRILFL